MMTLACKQLLEAERFSEALFRYGAAAAAEVCREADGKPCGRQEL